MKRFAIALAVATMPALPAHAGAQYIDTTGYAVSGYDVVAYRQLEQRPVGEAQPLAIPGRVDITAEFNGAIFAFSTKQNRRKFMADPGFFAPQFDGHCAYGVSRGGKVPGNPNLWRIVDDRLYLNITDVVVTFWEEDIPGNIALAHRNWTDLEPGAASGNVIPKFTSDAPISD